MITRLLCREGHVAPHVLVDSKYVCLVCHPEQRPQTGERESVGNTWQPTPDEDATDRMVAEASAPSRSLASLFKQGIDSGVIRPTAHYV
jgi:hypothetical protein